VTVDVVMVKKQSSYNVEGQYNSHENQEISRHM
jgi:hypothetical protein